MSRRSQKSFVRRRDPGGACSSVTKANRIQWIPSSGISVRVDLANLEKELDSERGSMRERARL